MTETAPLLFPPFELQAPDHIELKPYRKNVLFQTAKAKTQTILSKNDHFPGMTIDDKVYTLEQAMYVKWPNFAVDLYGADESAPKTVSPELAKWIDNQHVRWTTQDNVKHTAYPFPDKTDMQGIDPLAINQKYAAVAKVSDLEREIWLFRFATNEWRSTNFVFDTITGACFEECGDRLIVCTKEDVMCINVSRKPKKEWFKTKLFDTNLGVAMKATNESVFVFERQHGRIYVLNIESGHKDQVIATTGLSLAVWKDILCVGKSDGNVDFYFKNDSSIKKMLDIVNTAKEPEIVVVDKKINEPSYAGPTPKQYMKDYVSVTGVEIKLPAAPILTISLVSTMLFLASPTSIIMEQKNPDMPRLLALDGMGAVVSNCIVGELVISMLENSSVIIGMFGDSTDIYRFHNPEYPTSRTTGRQFVSGTFSQMQALMMNGDVLVFKPT